RPSRGHARDPAPGHLRALARLLEAVEEELVHGVVPAPRSRLSRGPPRSRPDRPPVARLVAELHARLRAPWRAARLSQAQPPRTARILPLDRAPAHDVRRSHAQSRGAHCNTPVA